MAWLGVHIARLYSRTAPKWVPCHQLLVWKLPWAHARHLSTGTPWHPSPYGAGLAITRCRHHRMIHNTQGPHAQEQHVDLTHKMLSKLSRMENSMRYHGYSTLRIGLGLLAVAGVSMYVFREYIRENVAGEVSTVAHRSLSDEVVIQKAEEVTKDLLHAIFTDPTIHKQAVSFLNILFTNQEVLTGLKQLLITIMRDPNTQQELTALLKWAINKAMSDPAFRDELATNLEALMDHDSVKASLLSLLTYALSHDVLKQEAEKFAREVLASTTVQEEASKLGQNAVKTVVADDVVQKQTGDAMWSAFMYSIRPWWWYSSPSESEKNSQQAQKENPPPAKETKSLSSHDPNIHVVHDANISTMPEIPKRTLPSVDQD